MESQDDCLTTSAATRRVDRAIGIARRWGWEPFAGGCRPASPHGASGRRRALRVQAAEGASALRRGSLRFPHSWPYWSPTLRSDASCKHVAAELRSGVVRFRPTLAGIRLLPRCSVTA